MSSGAGGRGRLVVMVVWWCGVSEVKNEDKTLIILPSRAGEHEKKETDATLQNTKLEFKIGGRVQ